MKQKIYSFIGMSGVGKTFWSEKLEEQGFKRFCIDDMIEKKLEPFFKKHGFKGINDVAKWMGQPYEDRFKKTQREYLKQEIACMNTALERVQKYTGNAVIDTTGSVIYTGAGILNKLKKHTTVVYFDAPQKAQNEMFEKYVEDPKPVIWGDIFIQKQNETEIEAIARCYLKLLNFRTKKYKLLADIKIQYRSLKNIGDLYDVLQHKK